MEELGRRIKSKRVELGKTLDWLGKKVNKKRQTIYQYETGQIKEIPINVVIKAAEAFGISLYELLGIEEFEESRTKIVDTSYPVSDSKEFNQLVIKCNGVFSKVFINGQEIEWLVGIKFSHKTEELAELELSTIVIPNGETLF